MFTFFFLLFLFRNTPDAVEGLLRFSVPGLISKSEAMWDKPLVTQTTVPMGFEPRMSRLGIGYAIYNSSSWLWTLIPKNVT